MELLFELMDADGTREFSFGVANAAPPAPPHLALDPPKPKALRLQALIFQKPHSRQLCQTLERLVAFLCQVVSAETHKDAYPQEVGRQPPQQLFGLVSSSNLAHTCPSVSLETRKP